MKKNLAQFEEMKLQNIARILGGKPGDITNYATGASTKYPNGDNAECTEVQNPDAAGCCECKLDGIGGGPSCNKMVAPIGSTLKF